MMVDVLFVLAILLVLGGLVMPKGNTWAKWVVILGCVFLVAAVIVGWDDMVGGFKEGFDAGYNLHKKD